jgi:regulator of chromosome condensation
MLKSKKFDKLAVGDNYTLGVTYDGELYGWGDGLIHFEGQKGAMLEPFRLPFPGKVVGVAAGSQHAAIIDNHGLVHTWGNGGQWFRGGGQLGHGDTSKQTQPK